ncbi:PAS domain S-box protein [bacterium]|nr:MAG: PAS domain S-box protein [bacterium]
MRSMPRPFAGSPPSLPWCVPSENPWRLRLPKNERGLRESSATYRFGFAITMIVMAVALRLLVDPILETRSPYAFFIVASLLTAWLAGPGPSVLVVVAGGLVGTFRFGAIRETQNFGPNEALALGTYLIVTSIALLISTSERRSLQARQEVLDLANARLRALDGERVARMEALERAYAAQQEIDQSRRDMARVLSGVSDGLMLTDRELRVLEINDAAAAVSQTPRDQAVGKVFEDIWPRASDMAMKYRTALDEGKPIRFDQVMRDGRVFDTSAYPSADGLAVFFQDVTDRVASEGRLRASEDRYRTLTNALPAIVWSSLPDGTLEAYNDRWYEYTGEVAGESPEWANERIHPSDRSMVADEWRNARLSGEPFEAEYRIEARNGEHRWFFGRALPSRREDGEIVRWLGAATDIHEIRLAKEREEFLNEIELLLRPIREADQAGRVVCEALARHFGVARALYALVDGDRYEALDGYNVGVEPMPKLLDLGVFAPEVTAALRRGKIASLDDTQFDPRTRDIYAEAYAPLQIRSFLTVPMLKDGEMRAMLVMNDPQPRAWTEADQALASELSTRLWDTVERISAEKATEASESRFRALAESSPNLVFMTDREGKTLFFNRYFQDYTGQTVESALGGTLESLGVIHPDDHRRIAARWLRSAQEGSEVREEARLREADGEYRWFDVRIVPLLDDARMIVRWVGSGNDIHDRKSEGDRLERLVKARTRELAQSNEELERFCYSVSHDLRAPLRAIMSASMIVLEDYGQDMDPGAKVELNRQARAARQLGELIDDLLELSRIGRTDVERRNVDVAVLAKTVWDDLRNPGTLSVPESFPDMADPRLIRLLLQNVLENTVKYAKPGEKPNVTMGKEGDVYFIRDCGIGMDPTYAEKVFEPFQRLHRDQDIPGTGIGLSNVLRIAERHGGRAWLESVPGESTTVWFSLGSES